MKISKAKRTWSHLLKGVATTDCIMHQYNIDFHVTIVKYFKKHQNKFVQAQKISKNNKLFVVQIVIKVIAYSM